MKWRLVAATAIAVAACRPALAADLPITSYPPPLPVAVYNWTGIYIGINGGFGTGNSNWSVGPIGTTGSFPTSGLLIGGTAGFNYQIGEYVFGIEGDGDWTNLHGNSGSSCGAISAVVIPPVSCQTQGQWLATVRGRVGYAFDRILLYGTGGAAFGNIQTGLNPPSTFDSSVEAGWTVGAGLEFAFAQNWTAKVEYLFVDQAERLLHDRRQLWRRCGLHRELQRKHLPRRRQLQIRAVVRVRTCVAMYEFIVT
jgi:outer membrane immunogenic protein